MGRLHNYLMQKPSPKRDKYFLDLHDEAYARVVAEGVVNIADISIEDITKELEPLLIHELSYSDCSPDKIKMMYEASMNIGDTLAIPPLSPAASDKERVFNTQYEQKIASIQNVLINYLLGEDDKSDPLIALRHWEVARLTSVCENYKRELCQNNAPYANRKYKKLVEINKLLAILTDKSTHSDDKIPAFTKQYEKHKSTLAVSWLEFDVEWHTPKLFKASRENNRLLSFAMDISHILAQVKKAAVSIMKQCQSHMKQEQSIEDINKIVRHP